VFKDKKVGFPFAGQADEGLVVIFNGADHFLTVGKLDPDQRRILD
jgi:hypothetical protein